MSLEYPQELGKKKFLCLITGATGFLGRNVMKHLFSLGYEVDLISSTEFKNENFSKLNDIPDVVIHFAWPTKTDLMSTEHLEFAEWSCHFFDMCKGMGLRVINIGSSSEYGVKYEPMSEDMICEPINAYGIAKLSVTLYAKLLGFNTLRIFSPYGEGGNNFISNYKKSKRYGNRLDNRDFQPLELVYSAVERLIHAKHLYGEIINVCTGVNYTNEEVVNVFDPLNSTAKEKKEMNTQWGKYPQKQYEPYLWVGNPDKMRKLLNI